MIDDADLVLLLLTADDPASLPPVAGDLVASLTQATGVCVTVRFGNAGPAGSHETLEQTLASLARPDRTIFIMPAEMQFDLFSKRSLADAVTWARRTYPHTHLFYDDVRPYHPLLLDALTDEVLQAASRLRPVGPRELSILLAASGHGDPEIRADSYKLMRLLWERIGAGHGGIGFLRYDNPMLAAVLGQIGVAPWRTVVAAQYLWTSEHYHYLETLVADAGRRLGVDVPLTRPLAGHPNISAWLRQRTLDMWWRFRMKTQRPMVRFSKKTKLSIPALKPDNQTHLTQERTP